MSETLELSRQLLRLPSVTPDDGGCLELLGQRLAGMGFDIERLDRAGVSNLWAKRGATGPVFCFAGHTDVVPAGSLNDWRHDPFAAEIADGFLYGRGSADMKGALAAMVTACEAYLADHHGGGGSIAFLLTSDEEGPATDGTVRVMEKLAERGQTIDYCLIGEPSSQQRLGDTLRVGRRGSLTGRLTIMGEQGHVAYPDLARNPMHEFSVAMAELATRQWDQGSDDFPPTGFQFVAIESGVAVNVIPATLFATFNFRYSPASNMESLAAATQEVLDRHGLSYRLEWTHGGRPFHTLGGRLIDGVCSAVRELTGIDPVLSTSGGTSDGRFIAPYGVDVVELGLINETIHKVDERVRVEDLDRLSDIYRLVLSKIMG